MGGQRRDWEAIDPELRALVAGGCSRRELSEQLGLPRATLEKRLADLGLSTAGTPANRYAAGGSGCAGAGCWQPSQAMLRLRAECAEAFGLSEAELITASRVKRVSQARQATCFVLRRRLGVSTPKVAVLLGGICHTTVVHACQQTVERMRRDPALAETIAMLIAGRKRVVPEAHVHAWALACLRSAQDAKRAEAARRPDWIEDPELKAFLKPARRYCGQCDRSVTHSEGDRCGARLCGLRRAA